MLKTAITCLLIMIAKLAMTQPINLYLIPGSANDHRLFSEYVFDTSLVRPIPIRWADTNKAKGIADYAQLLSAQVDTTAPFVLLGFSLGGMLAMEMGRILRPKGIVLVASMERSKDLPFKLKLARFLPLYKLMSEGMVRRASTRKGMFKTIKEGRHVQLYQSMVADTGAKRLKWQICAISHWHHEPDFASLPPIFHIHGNNDKVLPLRKRMKVDVVVPGGPHEIIINEMPLITGHVEGFIRSIF